MRKRELLLLAVSSAILIALILWVMPRKPEPHYDGRSLSSWLDASAYGPTLVRQHEATQAILQMGTNALPGLLQYIKYKPAAWKHSTTTTFSKLREAPLVGRFIPRSLATDRAAVRAEAAVYALVALEETATYAYPELARLACTATEPEASERAIRVLILRRADATNAIGFVLSNAPPQIRLKTLLHINVQRDLSLLLALQPALIQRLHDDDEEVAKWAGIIITQLKRQDPKMVLGILLQEINSPRPKIRAEVIKNISTFDSFALPAVPSVVPLLVDADYSVRKEATNLLRMIAPEALTNAPPR